LLILSLLQTDKCQYRSHEKGREEIRGEVSWTIKPGGRLADGSDAGSRGRLHAIRIKSENSGLGCEITIAFKRHSAHRS
jgi:hypothetical protein